MSAVRPSNNHSSRSRFAVARLNSWVGCKVRLTLRPIIFAALVLFFLATPAHATGLLSFNGGGYWVDLEIGQTEVPVIASVRFHHPGDPKGVVLPRSRVVVEAFDTRRQVLVLRFMGSEGADAIKPFTLSVNGRRAVLQLSAQPVVSRFSWDM